MTDAPTIVHGWDISLNHGAMVELTDGTLSNFWYYTDMAGSAAKSKKRGHRMSPEILKIKDKHVKGRTSQMPSISIFISLTNVDNSYLGSDS